MRWRYFKAWLSYKFLRKLELRFPYSSPDRALVCYEPRLILRILNKIKQPIDHLFREINEKGHVSWLCKPDDAPHLNIIAIEGYYVFDYFEKQYKEELRKRERFPDRVTKEPKMVLDMADKEKPHDSN